MVIGFDISKYRKPKTLLPGQAEEQLLESGVIPEEPVGIEPVTAPAPISTILPSGIIERAPVFPKMPTVEEADAAMKRLYPDVPDMQISYMQAYADQYPDEFVDEIRRQGRTPDTEIILKSLELPDLSVDEIFNEKAAALQKGMITVDGVRKLINLDVNTGIAYDDNGQKVATYNPIFKDFESKPREGFFKDTWDTVQYATRQYWELGENFVLGALPTLIYPEIDSNSYGGLGRFLNETNKQMRQDFRWRYYKNKKQYEDWIKKNPEIVPDVKFQEGAFKHPELLKDPRYLAYEMANVVPFIVAVGGISLATGGTGGAFLLASTSVMGAVEGGAVYEEARNAGASEADASSIALVGGTLIGLLESVGRIPLLKQASPLLFRKFKQEASKELVKKTMWDVTKKFGRNFTISQFAETATEDMQEVVGNVAVRFFDKNRKWYENLPDITVKTLVANLLPGAGGAAVSVRPGIREDIKATVDKAVRDERGFIGGEGEPSPESILSELRQYKADLEKELAAKYSKETEKQLRTIEWRIRDLQEKMEKPAPEKVTPVTVEVTKHPQYAESLKSYTEELSGASDLAVIQARESSLSVRTGIPAEKQNLKGAEKVLADAEDPLLGIDKTRVLESIERHKSAIADETARLVAAEAEIAKRGLKIPKAEPGMPEAGVQETMLPGEVSAKEVFPKGKGKVTQISMDEAAKLRAMEEEAKARLPVTPEEVRVEAEEGATKEFQNRMELEALKEEHAADPASKFVDVVAKAGSYKGEIRYLTRTQYRLLTGARWVTQTGEVGGKKFKRKILQGGSEPTPGMMQKEGGISTGKIRWEYALDTIATENKYADADAFKEAIEKALERKHTIDVLEGAVTPVPKPSKAEIEKAKAKPLALLPETSLEEQQANITPLGLPKLTMAQVDVLVGFFGEYLENPNTLTAWDLTRELRRESRAGRAENLKARAQELIVSKGLNAEEGMKQAIRESLSGELPAVSTGYFEGMVTDLRDALFTKVYQVLKEEPFEMASTITALTNALAGKPIPREPGVRGGSAFTRLQKVFGTQPKVLKAIEKIADEQKPLDKWVEGIYHETGREPIPIDQETADYLRHLSEIPFGQAMLGERYQPLPPLPLDTRTAAQKQTDLEAFKLELTPDQYKNWTPERLEQLSFLRINLLTSDYQAKLIESKWIPPQPLAKDTRTAAQKALDLQEFATELAPAPVGVSQPIYEAPIEEGIKAIPLWPAPAKDAIIRVLKEIGMVPIDIGNFLRAMKSSIDQSYWRQIMPLIAGHPKEFFQSNIDAWAGTFSQKNAEAQWERITRSPLYAIYDALQKKDGRDFLRPLKIPKGTAQWKTVEEMGNLIQERLIPRLTSKLPNVKLANRGFVSGINSATWGIFENFYKLMLRKSELYASGELKLKPGEVFDIVQAMDAEATKLADWTGRASLGPLAKAGPAIAALVYAPRYVVGRAIGPRHLFSANKFVRQEAWKDAALFVSVIGGFILLGVKLDWWETELDPRSADFMKIRIGNLHIDPWGGAQQLAVFFTKVAYVMAAPVTGEQAMGISTTTGMEYPLDFMSLTENFIKSKEAPLAAAFLEYMTGKTYGGEDIDVKNLKQWADRVAPMSIQDIWESIIEQPETTVIAGILSFTGFGVQTYTGDWKENFPKMGLPKYSDNLPYGQTEPKYDTADFWTDTAKQLKDVDPATLTEAKGFPDYIRAIAEAREIADQLDILPNEKLVDLNADASKGATFVQYYQMWKDREVIVASGDEEKLKTFDQDERTRNANLGNFSQRQFALLNEYWSIADKKKQVEFLEQHRSEIGVNLRTEALRSNPKENAQLAVWGQAKIMSLEAYNQTKAILQELDIPDSAIPTFALPPEKSVKNYFEYLKTGEEKGYNSWEVQLLMTQDNDLRDWLERDTVDTPPEALRLKIKHRPLFDLSDSYSNKESANYLDDTVKDKDGLTARDRAQAKLKTDNPIWVDDGRRIEAIEHNGIEHSEAWVARGKITDEFGGGSSEAKVWLLDNPLDHQWALEQELLTDDGADWNEAVLRINAAWRKQDKEYDAIDPDAINPETNISLRDEYLAKDKDYRVARRQRDFYSLVPDTTDELRDKYVGFTELPDKGYFKEHFLLDNPDLEATLTNPEIMKDKVRDKVIAGEVPDKMYDQIYLEFQEDFDKWDSYGNGGSPNYIANEEERKRARDRLVLNDRDFQVAMWKRDGYKLFIGNEGQVDNYVGWQVIQDKGKPETADYWFEDNWFLLDHPDFYKTMTGLYVATDGKQGWKPGSRDKELSRTPTREIYEMYLVYDAIIGSENVSQSVARKEYRRSHSILDAWLFLIGAVSKTIEQQDAEAKLTRAELIGRKLSEKRRVIDELRDELDRKLRALGIK